MDKIISKWVSEMETICHGMCAGMHDRLKEYIENNILNY